jgi:hypothetical protein
MGKSGMVVDVKATKVTKVDDTKLTASQAQRLRVLEDTIRDGLDSFMETGQALCKIRDERLYRQTHKSFKEYCEDKWGFGKTHGYNLINASIVATELSAIVDIPNEHAARELLKVKPEDRAAVTALANTASEGKIDAKWVRSAAAVWESVKATGDRATIERLQGLGGYVDDGNGQSINAVAAVVGERYEEMRKEGDRIRRKLAEKEGSVESEMIKGRAIVHSISRLRGGIIALVSAELSEKFKPGDTITFVIYPYHAQGEGK